MSDYISREAVKQIIAAQCGECADACLEFDGIQPDCNQCLLHGVLKELATIPAADVRPHWIPVTEQLPEQKINQNTLDFEYVLCVTTFGDVRPYKFGRRIGQGEPHFWNGAGYVDAYVTHWMPLPDLPEEGLV